MAKVILHPIGTPLEDATKELDQGHDEPREPHVQLVGIGLEPRGQRASQLLQLLSEQVGIVIGHDWAKE